jgi:photosystem II stability/assembly factor-like uncharacterized protein/PKD repeat protein
MKSRLRLLSATIILLFSLAAIKAVSQEISVVADTVSWKEIGPMQVPKYIKTGVKEGVGRIDCIAFHPGDTNTVYVGSPGGGLWRTSDHFKNWEPLSDNLPAIGIADIAIDPGNPERIFIATGDRDTRMTVTAGIFRTADGGQTWEKTSLSFDAPDKELIIHRLVLHPARADTQFAATNHGILRTFDAWESYDTAVEGHFRDMEIHPDNFAIIYAATYSEDGGAALYRSEDHGNNFSLAMDGISGSEQISRMELDVTQASPDLVYLLNVRKDVEDLHSFYVSQDRGLTWTVQQDGSTNILAMGCTGGSGIGEGNTKLAMGVSPIDENEIYVGSLFMWKSSDGGKTWKVLSGFCGGDIPYVRPNHHAMEVSMMGTVYTGSGSGIYRSLTGGKSWDKISSNLRVMDFYGFGISLQNAETNGRLKIYGGTRDNGILMLQQNEWIFLKDGSGTGCLVNYDDSNKVYIIRPNGTISRDTDAGMMSVIISPDQAASKGFFTPLAMHPSIPDILFAGYEEVYKTMDAGESWTSISDFGLSGTSLRSLSVSSLKPDVIYAASADKLWKTMDGGKSWSPVLAAFPLHDSLRNISRVICGPADPNKIWIANESWKAGQQVYYSSDGGTSWMDYSAGLPTVPVYDLEYEPGSALGLFAATMTGTYYRNIHSGTWIKYGRGLPNTRVTDLEINPVDSTLFVSTFGRGMWSVPLPTSILTLQVAEFSASSHTVCGGSSVSFHPEIKGNIGTVSWDFGEGANPATANSAGPHEVIYTTTGFKTITLVLNDSISERKSEYISSLSEISVTVFPDSSCSDQPVKLTAGGAASYSWSPANHLDLQSGAEVIASPPVYTTYTVTGTLGSCTDSANATAIMISDDICQALELSVGLNGPFTNQCATVQEYEPLAPTGSEGNGCNTQDGWCRRKTLNNTVWFKFIAPASGLVSIDAAGDFDNQIAVFRADSCQHILQGDFTFLAGNDDYHGEEGRLAGAITGLGGLTPGETYWVMVDGGSTGESGTFHLHLSDTFFSTGITTAVRSGDLIIRPNPVRDSFSISGLPAVSSAHIKVYDITGKVYLTESRDHLQTGEEIRISMSGKPDGIYFVSIRTDSGLYRTKLVKE